MHRILRGLLATLGLFAAACETPAPAGRQPNRAGAGAPGPPTQALSLAEQARELSASTRPGPAHLALEPLVGDWDVTVATVAADGLESDPFHGRASLAWSLGGRFVRWEASVAFGELVGTTTGFLGFDIRTHRYQLMMISDLATGMEIARGGGELRGAGLVFELEQVDPSSGVRLVAKSRLRSLGPDHFVLEQLEPTANGKDRVTRVWNYRRAQVPKR